jgi:hypothetical protein
VPIALPLLGGFALGLVMRRRWQRHFPTAFRVNTGAGLAVLAFLAGWSFQGGRGGVAVLGLLLAAQVGAVTLGAWLFRDHVDGPLLSFSLYGNAGFWSVPVTAAVFGARSAVVIATYDMLTAPRVAAAVRFMRARAPVRQRARTGLVDYAPTAAAVAGLGLGRVHGAPGAIPLAVVALSTTLSAIAALLLGLAWPRGGWLGGPERRLVVRVLGVHLTLVPAVLVAASLAGVAVPDGAWILALGPLPIASLSFARLYGYSARVAACGLAVSMGTATGLLPLAAWLGHRLPAA